MTIPELLKEAYTRNDWSIIAEAYEMLTGQLLQKNSTTNDAIPLEIVETEPKQETGELDFEFRWKNDNNIRGQKANAIILDDYQMPTSPNGDKKPCRTEQINTSKNNINIFVDDRTVAREDVAIDRLLTNRPISPRNQRNEMISVRCRQCRKDYIVSKSIVAGSYLCDLCIGGSQWKNRN